MDAHPVPTLGEPTQGMYIDGRWMGGERTSAVVSPADEHEIARVPIAEPADVARALAAAARAQRPWARATGVERGRLLRRWAELIERDRERLARIIVGEQGKPLAEARGEVDLGLSWLRYYAGYDRRIAGESLAADRPGEQLWILAQPVGVVVGIIPWNYPLAVALRKAAPALIAGNAIVIKPHEATPLSALALARLAEEAGLPPGVLNVVTGPGASVGEALVAHPLTGLVTFTGSVATGKRIMRTAADNVTVVSLELGGKAPFLVMDDADLDAAIDAAVATRFMNCGQVCICNERTYVHAAIADEFTSRLAARVAALRVGDPLADGTQVGPKFSRAELEKVERGVAQAVADGARVLTGGRRLRDGIFARGHWYAPTVVVDAPQSSALLQEEIFGPVVPVLPFADFDEAMALANDSRFGLAAYLFTGDLDRALRAMRELEVGELYINRGAGESVHGYHSGWKHSGIGGDDGSHGLDHYLRRKTVYLATRAGAR